jgi:hypothetical protein
MCDFPLARRAGALGSLPLGAQYAAFGAACDSFAGLGRDIPPMTFLRAISGTAAMQC